MVAFPLPYTTYREVEGIGRGKNTGNKKQPDEKFLSHLRIGKLITL